MTLETAPVLTYANITAEQFSSLRSSLASRGLTILGNSGEIRKFGADVDFGYSPDRQTLTLEIKHSPWTMSSAKFAAELDSAIKAAL